METSETSCPWRESSVVLRTSRAAGWVELSSRGVALPAPGCCSGGAFRALWDAECVVPQGELPVGASLPLQELHPDLPAKAVGWYLLLGPPERQGESVN